MNKRMLDTGIQSIDEDHAKILAELDQLAPLEDTDEPNLKRLLMFIEQHVTGHFEDEEAHMKTREYPDQLRHRLEHLRLQGYVSDLRGHIDQEGFDPEYVDVTVRLLANWLRNHIDTADRDYAAFIKERA